MSKTRIWAVILLLISGAVGYFVYGSQFTNVPYVAHVPFRLGLDLNGGTHLMYRADTTQVAEGEVDGAMNSLREVIERRVNLFGVSEPLVQVVQGGNEQRLIVELPGVTDVGEAIRLIGKTPSLEFKLATTTEVGTSTVASLIETGFDGKYIEKAQLVFDPNSNEPIVALTFTDAGQALFADITANNIGSILAITLDDQPISLPVIRQEIRDGQAQISGGFTIEEARQLVRDLNYGALPVPIELISTQSIGPSLGEAVLNAGLKAGVIAFIAIAIFLILWYRLPGLVAVVAMTIYVIINLALFKLIPVTLTAAGIAAFILSLGMAVDANILIFERTKEELRRGKNLKDSVHEGFHRAWPSIRDSNFSSILTGAILFYLASTSVVKGFALVFMIGVFASMFTAITATRTLLYSLPLKDTKVGKFLFSSGIK
jgi:protein-export membrane protein SecD